MEVRIRENIQIDDWELDEPDMKELALLDRDFRYCIGYGHAIESKRNRYHCGCASAGDYSPGIDSE
jgi:diketogulonate reductase-like aldo/keto reductase